MSCFLSDDINLSATKDQHRFLGLSDQGTLEESEIFLKLGSIGYGVPLALSYGPYVAFYKRKSMISTKCLLNTFIGLGTS